MRASPIRTRLEHLARQHGIEPDEAFWRMTLVSFATLVLERQEDRLDPPSIVTVEDATNAGPSHSIAIEDLDDDELEDESSAEIEKGEDRADRKR